MKRDGQELIDAYKLCDCNTYKHMEKNGQIDKRKTNLTHTPCSKSYED